MLPIVLERFYLPGLNLFSDVDEEVRAETLVISSRYEVIEAYKS